MREREREREDLDKFTIFDFPLRWDIFLFSFLQYYLYATQKINCIFVHFRPLLDILLFLSDQKDQNLHQQSQVIKASSLGSAWNSETWVSGNNNKIQLRCLERNDGRVYAQHVGWYPVAEGLLLGSPTSLAPLRGPPK